MFAGLQGKGKPSMETLLPLSAFGKLLSEEKCKCPLQCVSFVGFVCVKHMIEPAADAGCWEGPNKTTTVYFWVPPR